MARKKPAKFLFISYVLFIERYNNVLHSCICVYGMYILLLEDRAAGSFFFLAISAKNSNQNTVSSTYSNMFFSTYLFPLQVPIHYLA